MDRTGITFSTIAERVGWNLRIARRRAGLTQDELAERMGNDQSGISAWESGRYLPRVESIVRLAEVLEIDPGELLRETQGLAS